uniref:Protein kinase domain-containing protein n=1 Tax=Aegilops tauschii TaxID=37682 RepID=M8CES5_AEGTA
MHLTHKHVYPWEADPTKLVVRYLIASGPFGDMYHGVYDGLEVTVKLLDCKEDGSRSQKETTVARATFSQGVSVWHKLDHPNVTKLRHDIDDDIVWKHTDSGHYSAESATRTSFMA